MALATGGLTTYTAKGLRESLKDMIYMISPTETPYVSSAKRGTATNTLHQWQTDALAAAASNAQLEGAETTGSSSSPTTLVSTICQISTKDVVITGTQEVVKKAGRKSEVAYQTAKKLQELKRDIEFHATQNSPQAAGDATTPRLTRGLETYLLTNDSRGNSGVQATVPTAAPTDGDRRTLTEAIYKANLQACYTSGAEPTLTTCSAYAKGLISGFAGRANAVEQVQDKRTIVATASIYASDFGNLKVMPNRFQRSRTLFNLDPRYASIDYLRDFKRTPLGKTGDNYKELITVEWANCVLNEAAMGVVADLWDAAT